MSSIKQIEDFKSKYLRMAGFVEYVQQVLKLFTDFRNSGEEGQSQLPVKVEPVYTSYKDSVTAVDDAYKLSRASDYTQKIADEDDRRDNLYKQLVSLLKMFKRFGYDTEKKAALFNAREHADKAYRDLVLSLNASAVMDDDAHRFDELIKYYRLYVVPQAGKKDEEGGSSTGNESGSDSGTSGNGGLSSGSNGGSSQTGGNTPAPNPQPNPGGNSGGDDDEPDQ